MTALELILLELILVPAPGSQFACVHNNETRAALAAMLRGGVANVDRGGGGFESKANSDHYGQRLSNV